MLKTKLFFKEFFLDTLFKIIITCISIFCFFHFSGTGIGQEPFPENFSLSDNPNLRKIAESYNKNYGNLKEFYVLMNGHYLSKDQSVEYRNISEIYFKGVNIRYDLKFPSQNYYATIIEKNGEFTYFQNNSRSKWVIISHQEHVYEPINLFDPRKFCGLDSFKIDFFSTIKNLKNVNVKESIKKDGIGSIEISGTNVNKKIHYTYMFSSKNDFLVTSLLVDYGNTLILYESEYANVIELGIKFPKRLTKRYFESRSDFDQSKDNCSAFCKYDLIIFPNYKVNENMLNFSTPEGYTVKDLIRNPGDKISLKNY